MARPMRWLYTASLVGAMGFVACDSLEDVFVKRTPGEKLYRKLCADCHGIDGSGNTPRGMGNPNNDLTDPHWKYGSDPGSWETIIRQGVFGDMPAHDELTDEQVRGIVDHILKLRGESR